MYIHYDLGSVVLPATLHLEVHGGGKDLPTSTRPGQAQSRGEHWHRGQEVCISPGFDKTSIERSPGIEGKRYYSFQGWGPDSLRSAFSFKT